MNNGVKVVIVIILLAAAAFVGWHEYDKNLSSHVPSDIKAGSGFHAPGGARKPAAPVK
jgi:hypothetical protein